MFIHLKVREHEVIKRPRLGLPNEDGRDLPPLNTEGGYPEELCED